MGFSWPVRQSTQPSIPVRDVAAAMTCYLLGMHLAHMDRLSTHDIECLVDAAGKMIDAMNDELDRRKVE